MKAKKQHRKHTKRESKSEAIENEDTKIIGLMAAIKDKDGELVRPTWHRWVYGGGRRSDERS